jgi:histidinol phosphatase-like PHP family hydrolase
MKRPAYFCRARKLSARIPAVDLHLHTTFTDGHDTIHDYAAKAADCGIRTIAFCEHVNHGTDWFPAFLSEAATVAERFPAVRILTGVEVRAAGYEGELNAADSLLEQSTLTMGVVHRYPSPKHSGEVLDPSTLGIAQVRELELRAALSVLRHPRVDILGHPGATFEKYFGEFPLPLYATILEAAKKREVAIELNPAYQRNFPAFVHLCIEKDVLVSLGSNAHSVAELGRAGRAVKEALDGFTP